MKRDSEFNLIIFDSNHLQIFSISLWNSEYKDKNLLQFPEALSHSLISESLAFISWKLHSFIFGTENIMMNLEMSSGMALEKSWIRWKIYNYWDYFDAIRDKWKIIRLLKFQNSFPYWIRPKIRDRIVGRHQSFAIIWEL